MELRKIQRNKLTYSKLRQFSAKPRLRGKVRLSCHSSQQQESINKHRYITLVLAVALLLIVIELDFQPSKSLNQYEFLR